MDDQFRTRSCFVGIVAYGAERIGDGIERRDASATMVPDETPDPADAVVDCTALVTDDQFSEFDVVITTGSAAVDDAVDAAVRVGDACASDAITIAAITGYPTATDLTRFEVPSGPLFHSNKRGGSENSQRTYSHCFPSRCYYGQTTVTSTRTCET